MPSHAERYGPAHRRRRAALRPSVEAGLAVCARCAKPIAPGEPWDLGHVDGREGEYAGPEHRACNRATMTHARQAKVAKTSRDW